jgi:hypothetical protein
VILALAAIALIPPPQVDPFACDYVPEPLPAWVDALSLKSDPTFVNDRNLRAPWKEKYPSIRVGDITQAISADSNLVLKFMTPVVSRIPAEAGGR